MSDLYVNSRLTIAEKEIKISAARSSGPGGQNVNKVNSKVTLRWSASRCDGLDQAWRRRFLARHANRINREGQLVLHSERYRDQGRNLADVRQKLVSMLLECQSAPKTRKATRPTKGSQRRRLEQKRRQSQKKQNRRGPSQDD
jgi:ribosome-associated protein